MEDQIKHDLGKEAGMEEERVGKEIRKGDRILWGHPGHKERYTVQEAIGDQVTVFPVDPSSGVLPRTFHKRELTMLTEAEFQAEWARAEAEALKAEALWAEMEAFAKGTPEKGNVVVWKRPQADLFCIIDGVNGDEVLLRHMDSPRDEPPISVNKREMERFAEEPEREAPSDLLKAVRRQREIHIPPPKGRRKKG